MARILAKFCFCAAIASGRYGILPSVGSTITCARSRFASALFSAIQTPRRSAAKPACRGEEDGDEVNDGYFFGAPG